MAPEKHTRIAATISTDCDEFGDEYMALFVDVFVTDFAKGDVGRDYFATYAIDSIDHGVAKMRKWCKDRNLPVPPIYYISTFDPAITFWIHTHASEGDITPQHRMGLVG